MTTAAVAVLTCAAVAVAGCGADDRINEVPEPAAAALRLSSPANIH